MIRRQVKLPVRSDAAKAKAQKASQERYFVKLVLDSPYYRMIVSSLAEGVAATEIARHFAENGWTGKVNERTFAEALRTFKRVKIDVIEGALDGAVNETCHPNAPRTDPLAYLDQMMRVQRHRISINLQFEKNAGMLVQSTTKDIEIAGKLAETMLKAQGKLHDGARGVEAMPADVAEDLTRVKKEEMTRHRLHALTRQLTEVQK